MFRSISLESTFGLKDFQHIESLGFGTNGTAYSALDEENQQKIVIKCIPNFHSQQLQPFKSKLLVTFPSLLSYCGIRVVEINSLPHFLLLSEFYEKGSLAKHLSSKLTPTQKSKIIFGTAAAMYFLHSNNIIHGHLYPSNILLDSNMEPKVVDFGLYQFHQNDQSLLLINKKSQYIAPEYMLSSSLNEGCDVYSFGMLVYCILTDSLLQEDSIKFLSKTALGQRPEIPSTIDDFYATLIRNCWAHNPDKRITFSKILSDFYINNSFIINGSDIKEVRLYQDKIIPKGFSVIKSSKQLYFLPYPSINLPTHDFHIFLNNFNYQTQYETLPKNKEFTMIYDSSPEPKIVAKITTKPIQRESERLLQQMEEDIIYKKVKTVKVKQKKIKKSNSFQTTTKSNSTFDLKVIAKSGNVESQYKYGMMLLNGQDCEKNQSQGAYYIKMAADSGFLKAQRTYSFLLKNGTGVNENPKLSLYYMKLAANSGDLTSQMEYASQILELGENIQQNLKESAKYYKAAAQQNNNNAKFIYATILLEGKGVQKNIIEAIKYYRLAADQGHFQSQLKLAMLLNNSESSKYMKMAADAGDAKAQTLYAKMLFKGKNIEKNIQLGLRYLNLAIEQNDKEALYIYGKMLYYELNNPKQGIIYIKKSTKLGNIKAIFQYGLILGHFDYINNNNIFQFTNIYKSNDMKFNHWPLLYIHFKGISLKKILKAKNFIKNAADNGLIEAQYFYALMLHYGEGVDSNILEAIKYYKVAADNGHKFAQLSYAILLDDGFGVSQNLREAAKYYKLAADNNEINSIVNYAFMLYSGRGINRNKKEAAKYFKKAADEHSIVAQYKYGVMLFLGQSIPRNVPLAVHYFNLVIFDNEHIQLNFLRHAYDESILQMKQESARLIRMSAEQNCTDGQQKYAIMLLKGQIFPKDIKESMKYFKKAAEKGDILSQNQYALYLEQNKQFKEAAKYYKMAADQNHPQAQLHYAIMLDNGVIESENNFVEAAKYYKMSADQGVVQSQLFYGNMLENGDGIPRNFEEAAKYYKMASKTNVNAMLLYGKLLKHGRGVKQDLQSAAFYLKKAADNKNKFAQYSYAKMVEKGEGTKKDLKIAARYYKMSADNFEMTKAQFKYAQMLQKGIGVRKNYKLATRYYRLASQLYEPDEVKIRKIVQKALFWIAVVDMIFMMLYLFIYIIKKRFI